MGHALNKILKDIIVKHKTMMGFKAPYVPGWDCHGLPIEHNVMQGAGRESRKPCPRKRSGTCAANYADKFVKIQMEEFKRLGVFGDYENPYKTMTRDYEATIVEIFGKILETGIHLPKQKADLLVPHLRDRPGRGRGGIRRTTRRRRST